MKLMLIVPHPDDEVYGAGGTIMEWTDAGHAVGLVTLTRGEKGRTLGLANTPQELAALRAEELRACLTELNVTEHAQHEFPDGGLKDVPLQDLVNVAREAMLKHQPEIVLTFPPNGANGHPDHVTTSTAVRQAWAELPVKPELWVYAGMPPQDPKLLETYLAPNVERDVTPFVARKLRAMACHRSQALSTVDWLRRFSERVSHETFHRLNAEQ